MHAKSLQLCLTLCNSITCSPSGSSVHVILQEYWSGLLGKYCEMITTISLVNMLTIVTIPSPGLIYFITRNLYILILLVHFAHSHPLPCPQVPLTPLATTSMFSESMSSGFASLVGWVFILFSFFLIACIREIMQHLIFSV